MLTRLIYDAEWCSPKYGEPKNVSIRQQFPRSLPDRAVDPRQQRAARARNSANGVNAFSKAQRNSQSPSLPLLRTNFINYLTNGKRLNNDERLSDAHAHQQEHKLQREHKKKFNSCRHTAVINSKENPSAPPKEGDGDEPPTLAFRMAVHGSSWGRPKRKCNDHFCRPATSARPQTTRGENWNTASPAPGRRTHARARPANKEQEIRGERVHSNRGLPSGSN
uniref:Uncharacterized protein n=1 Tax=Trichuris muris TaxID=70415 RepID=A0A5S6R3F7_TRIMR